MKPYRYIVSEIHKGHSCWSFVVLDTQRHWENASGDTIYKTVCEASEQIDADRICVLLNVDEENEEAPVKAQA